MINKFVLSPAAASAADTRVRGLTVKSRRLHSLLTFLMVAGPGLIVMEADNDAGAVSTYIQAGAQYGTRLLWVLLLLLPITYFVQEMVVRLGIATGEGHAAMIYRRFGKWWGLFSLADLQIVNFLTLVTEFAAIDLALAQFGVDPRLGVPIAALGLILMAVTGSYRRWERIVIFLCLLDLAWLFLAFQLNRHAVAAPFHNRVVTGFPVFLIIAIVGTTIAPWQLFFQQSAVADKRLRFADLKWARLDTFVGACFTIAVAACMLLVGNAARAHGLSFTDPARMASDLAPYAGSFARHAILLLMINAALLGSTAISLSSAWAYGEVRGWPHSLQQSVREAPGFYTVYLGCVMAAAGIVLIPGTPLELITKQWTFTGDYQHVASPAYNRDRGPVGVWSLRVHWER